MMRFLYSLMLTLMLPLIVVRLFWRGVRQPGYREHILERFGRYHQPQLKRCIWIHAVSVGETRATEPLIRRLKTRYPTRPILLTSMTPTGRATANELFGDTVTCVYLPYDIVTLHQRLIDHFQPSALLIMETEIWPSLLFACERNGLPAFLINGRLSEKSLHGYARVAVIHSLVQRALASVRAVAAQSEADAGRFRALGAKNIIVTGNIKFDLHLETALVALGETWRTRLGGRRVLLCASTREGEESRLLDAYVKIFDAHARRDLLLVIVPRHPQRFNLVADAINGAGLRFNRRSLAMQEVATDLSMEVLLGDSMGEMAAYYALCDVVIIGGSFLPLGGQNLIEACALGKPVIMGQSTFNFAEATQLAKDAGAMLQVHDALDAMRTAQALLRDNVRQQQMRDAGFRLMAANRGATETTLALIATSLEGN